MSRFTVKGQQGFYGKFLPKMLKRDLMYMEDRWVMKQKVCLKRFRPGNFWETFSFKQYRLGNVLLQQMHQKIPDSGTWGTSTAPASQVCSY